MFPVGGHDTPSGLAFKQSSLCHRAPSQHESAGKRRSSRTGKGNRALSAALIQAAWAAVKVKESFVAAFYRRLAARRGNKKAIVAVAHKILVIVYTLLKTGEVYQERGAAYLDERQQERLLHRLQLSVMTKAQALRSRPLSGSSMRPA